MDQNTRYPTNVEREDFYDEMISLITSAKKSIWLYSVSACFGFYSQGVRTLEIVLAELKTKLQIKKPLLDIKCLIKIDHHGIDLFAAEHFQELNRNREIVRQLRNLEQDENIQFILTDLETDNPHLLLTEIQDIWTTPILHIDINRLKGGQFYNFKCNEIENKSNLFMTKWNSSSELSVFVLDFELSNVINHIKQFVLPARPKDEFCISHNLAAYLRGIMGNEFIQLEEPCPNGRIDIVVASGTKKIGIEVKYNAKKKDVDSYIGQVVKYKDVCDSVILYSVKPSYNHYEAKSIAKNLKSIDVEFIEKR